MATNTKVFTLTGDALIAFVNDKMPLVNRGELTRTDMIKDAGYINDNGTAVYVDFYTELLRAKGITPVTYSELADIEYDDLPSVVKELYDAVDEKLGEKWSHEEVMQFIDELDDIGIDTAEQFDKCFEGIFDSHKEFAEYLVTDVMDARIPDVIYNCIDWDDVWERELRYDYNVIDFDYSLYIFRNN